MMQLDREVTQKPMSSNKNSATPGVNTPQVHNFFNSLNGILSPSLGAFEPPRTDSNEMLERFFAQHAAQHGGAVQRAGKHSTSQKDTKSSAGSKLEETEKHQKEPGESRGFPQSFQQGMLLPHVASMLCSQGSLGDLSKLNSSLEGFSPLSNASVGVSAAGGSNAFFPIPMTKSAVGSPESTVSKEDSIGRSDARGDVKRKPDSKQPKSNKKPATARGKRASSPSAKIDSQGDKKQENAKHASLPLGVKDEEEDSIANASSKTSPVSTSSSPSDQSSGKQQDEPSKRKKRKKQLSSETSKYSEDSGERGVDDENFDLSRRERKNNREKQRRSEVNAMFDKLNQALDIPPNVRLRLDKISLLSTAIATIENLKTQVEDLRGELAALKTQMTLYPPPKRD